MATKFTLPKKTPHLRLLKKNLTIPALFGIQTLVSERAIFPGYFELGNACVKDGMQGNITESTQCAIYEMVAGGNLASILSHIDENIKPFHWKSEDQIITWVKKYPKLLNPDGHCAFFPLIIGGQSLTISVGLHSKTRLPGVSVLNQGFKSKFVFTKGAYPRLVIPLPN